MLSAFSERRNHIDADFPLEIFDYSVYGKSLDEWDYDSLKQYASTYMELNEELKFDNGTLLYNDDLRSMYINPIEDNIQFDVPGISINEGPFDDSGSLNTYSLYQGNGSNREKVWSVVDSYTLEQPSVAEDYLETVYPGLYDTLNTQKMVRFNNCYITFEFNPNAERPLIHFYWENKKVLFVVMYGDIHLYIEYTNDTLIFPWEE